MWGKEKRDAQNQFDSAQATAARAITMIESHISICDRREQERLRVDQAFRQDYAVDTSEAKQSLNLLHTRVSNVSRNMNVFTLSIAGTLILLLIGVLGTIITRGLPWAAARPEATTVPSAIIVLTPEMVEQLRKK